MSPSQPSSSSSSSSSSLSAEFHPLIAAMLAYCLLYYAFMVWQARVKISLLLAARRDGRRFDRYRSDDATLLAADRTVGNMLEHTPVFVLCAWSFALATGEARHAARLAFVYVALRSLYPLLFQLPGWRARGQLLVTFPMYAIVAYWAARTLAIVGMPVVQLFLE